MAEIQEISLDETNKLRAKLGLPLIPADDKVEPAKKVSVKTEEEEDSISIDSKNRLRNLLGLQPISSDNVTTADQERIARDNWERKQRAEREQKEVSAAAEAREETERQRLLSKYDTEKGILDSEKGEKVGVKSFLKALKKDGPKKSDKLVEFEKKLAEEESKTYSEKDLAGLKVGHSLEDFESLPEGTELTFKDTGVLEDGEDELVSSELLQKRQREKHQETQKTRHRRYHGYDNDDNKGILAKYDEEEEEFFVLTGSALNPVKKEEQEEVKQELHIANNDFDDVSQDVLKAQSGKKAPKFKKRKKASKPQVLSQVKRRRMDDEDDEMRDGVDDRDDDYDVQARLAKNRLKVLKEKSAKVDTAEETIDRIMENKFAEIEEQSSQNNGVLLNDTTQFLSSINLPADESKEEDEDMTMELTPEAQASGRTTSTTTTDVPEEVKPNTAVQAISSQAPTISGGLGDTLRLLRSTGHIKEKTAAEKEADERRKGQARIRLEMQRIQSEFKRKAAEEKEHEESLLRHLSPREREEYQQKRNQRLTDEMSRAIEELFQDYKPEVSLKYYDNEGNELDSKAAYKHLSHQFHGRDPGKAKIEKNLKKREEAKKKEQRSIFNPTSRQ